MSLITVALKHGRPKYIYTILEKALMVQKHPRFECIGREVTVLGSSEEAQMTS